MTSTLDYELPEAEQLRRPLRDLSKEQLFQYPLADPSDEAFTRFCAEISHRRGQENKLRERLAEAKRQIENAKVAQQMAIQRGGKKDRIDAATRWLAKLLANEAKIDKELAGVQDHHYLITHSAVQKFFKDKHWEEYETLRKAYVQNTLFNAQSYGFRSFLRADSSEHRADIKAFEEFRNMASLVSEEGSELFKDAYELYCSRIVPPLGQRHRFTDEEGSIININALSPELQKEFHIWRAVYNKKTVAHTWIDNNGEAYPEEPQEAA